jgi:hypothetical protein
MSVGDDESFRVGNQEFSQTGLHSRAPAVCRRRRERAVGARPGAGAHPKSRKFKEARALA